MNSGRPPYESMRLRALHDLDLLDTPAQAAFDDTVQLAATVCGTPIALVSLVDGQRLRFKARLGLTLAETPAEHGFCTLAIQNPAQVLVVPDTRQDPRFDLNPLVCGVTQARFYAGATIITDDGWALGTVCVLDRFARQLTPEQAASLQLLARQLGQRLSECLEPRRRQTPPGPDEGSLEKLNQAQRELEWALHELSSHNQRQQQFIYMVSHDLREPVNAIQNFCSLLQEDATQPQASAHERARYLGFIRDGSQRMRTMLDDLLDLVRLDASLPSLEPVDLNHLMQQVRDDLSDTVTRSGAQVQIDVTGEALGVESLLRVLFQNLVSNAVKFSKKGQAPRVCIRARMSGARVEVSVCDQGIGIPTSHMPKLFDLFKRHTSFDEYPGTGLGLAICRRIVDRHRGDITVQSREGEGTTVQVTLMSAAAASLLTETR